MIKNVAALIKFIAHILSLLIYLFIPLKGVGQPGLKKEAEKMNVVFIVVDDLRPTLGCYDDPGAVTPHMDQLAQQGVVFMKAYCQQAVCNPSRTSMLTGLRPDQISVTDLKTHFRDKRPEVITLPQIFKDNGYTTVGLGKIFHGAANTLDESSWSVPTEYALSLKKEEYTLPENQQGGKAFSTESAAVEDTAYEDGKIAYQGIQWLKEFKKSKAPFFLALGFKKPHLPFAAPQKYWDLYQKAAFSALPDKEKPKGAPPLAFHQWQELRGYTDIPEEGKLSPAKEQALRHGYYACVSYVDAQIGKILKALDEGDLRKNTIIVLWGDHGFHLGEQQLWAKSTNFELDVRIPLIIAVPDLTTAGRKTEAIVEAVDLYPTLISLCGIQPTQALAGRNLTPLLQQPDKSWKQVAFSQFPRPYNALFKGKATHMGYSVRSNHWRYTAWFNMNTGTMDYKELYALEDHPAEKENLSGQPAWSALESGLLHLVRAYQQGQYNDIRTQLDRNEWIFDNP